MSVPIATYRLQFRNGMTFDRAITLIDYWKALGISHLYASPIFAATEGSTHGYDVTDANAFDPALGGREGFDRLSAALKAAGIGLILDIVPNHMAASLENRWWRSVVEWGEQSPYAHYYDIDWSRPLTIAELGKSFDEALDEAEIEIRLDETAGNLALGYYESNIPLHPSSYSAVLDGAPGTLGAKVVALASSASAQDDEAFHHTMLTLIEDSSEQDRKALTAFLGGLPVERVKAAHEAQAFRLVHWKTAASDLSYRRFFEVAGLAGLRVEAPDVFDAAHRLVLELVKDGTVDGLRIDHVDGLADPEGYLKTLRDAVGPDVYLVVEKIIEEDERVPASWPIAGTTGYEFIAALAHLFVDSSKAEALDNAYAAFAGGKDYAAILTDAKQLMLDRNFEGEIKRLVALAGSSVREAHDAGALETALKVLITAFPVYRTYGTRDALGEDDRKILHGAAEAASKTVSGDSRAALDAIVAVLSGPAEGDAFEFRSRFQQVTGPIMAKAMEDTAFYRYHRLLALNEVGGNPAEEEMSIAHFHSAMQRRAVEQPHAITTTSTHDTKRGEDARARLYAISEAPGVWADAVARWHDMNAGLIKPLADGPAPEPAVEWALYQALAGAWEETSSTPDTASLEAFKERFSAYVEKMLREAKERSDWSEVNEDYEGAVQAFAAGLLSPDNKRFMDDFLKTVQPFARAGLVNGLTQTLVKMTAPGVPDVYQGSERADFSLVDPDNRRMPDYAAMAELLEKAEGFPFDAAARDSGQAKIALTARLIAARCASQALFKDGDYHALDVSGEGSGSVVAYARRSGNAAAIVVAPCKVLALMEKGDLEHAFDMIEISLPEDLAARSYRNVLQGGTVDVGETLSLKEIAGAPYILLITE
ncbi:malto-oligosyltrehalose synthase [Rhizobium sp. NFR03]|uniref:malto-oligosyltrehalose synthase n=1 Tax=Rhizobium sp. NFR03 TaxID=1566263 RepID=UPI0008C54430|nr:malto-oligosyltrehalose synthase [Rhizobium sp. NFR03]SES32783.1 (1->4)-alpha-D-glucan 1-alpha-D-glucosylmutase [Rhizobium sp. NFR03]